MKYRKKPIVIDAKRFFPDCRPWPEGVHGIDPNRPEPIVKDDEATAWGIQTLEGWHLVSPGDWIITGVKGEHYPVKPDIFEITYERAVNPHMLPAQATADKVCYDWIERDVA